MAIKSNFQAAGGLNDSRSKIKKVGTLFHRHWNSRRNEVVFTDKSNTSNMMNLLTIPEFYRDVIVSLAVTEEVKYKTGIIFDI